MKKYITAAIFLFALLCFAPAYAASIDAAVELVQGSTNIKGNVSVDGAACPTAVTVTAKNEAGELNYIDIIMTDDTGTASFEYNNLGKSGAYTFCFNAAALNVEKTIILDDFKGYDYWEEYLLKVSAAAKNNDVSVMKSLIITEGSEFLGIDLTGYDALADKDEAFAAMIKNCSEYTSQGELIKEFYASVRLCEYNLSKSADVLKQIYSQEAALNLFDLYTELPDGNNGNTVLDDLPDPVKDKVYAEISGRSYEKSSDLTAAFVLHTLIGTIKNADHYGTVKTVLESYNNAGLVSLDIKSDADFNAVSKSLLGKGIQSIKSVEEAFNEAVKALASGNKTAGGGGSGSGAVYAGASVNRAEPVKEVQTNGSYQSGNMYFSDMEDAKWALEAVNLLYQKGIISGSGENRFEPHRVVTRAEMAKMAVDTAGLEKVTDGADFIDVSESDWFYTYVMTACKAGIFVGRDGNMFASRESISRQEAATVIYRMIKDKLGDNAEPETVFDDDDSISDWAKEAVYALRENGIMKGRSSVEFCPDELLTRAEAAVLFSAIIKYYI